MFDETPEPTTPTVPLRVEVVAEPVPTDLHGDLRAALHSHSVIRLRYPNADLWLAGVDMLEKGPVGGPESNAPFRAALADMAGSGVAEVAGVLWDLDGITVVPTSRPRLPDDEEHAWAVGVLRTDPDLARRLDAGEVEAYRPMPPLASEQDADGSVIRAVTVGLREPGESGEGVRHRLVSVRSVDGEVQEESPAIVADCGLPDGPSAPAGPGVQQARLRVLRGDELLWSVLVVRPSASSGANGSGIELRAVEYLGLRVLHRAHLPIVNVAYDDGGAERHWLNDEAGFGAEGDGGDPVGGFRVCTAAPRTILEAGHGGGPFRGVAVWVDGDAVVLTSQLQAGWYRYVSEWRLHADGTLRPRFGVAAVRNPSTCRSHTHHVYWRLDFDILRPGENLVQEFNEPRLEGQLAPWHTVKYEVSRPREPGRRRQWRVRSVRSPHGYAVLPGPHDGTADAFGAGDVWVLAYDGAELDDGEGFTADPARARAQLDRFVSGDMVEREDVVVWYAAHVRHDTPTGDEGGPRVGPELQPFSWKPVAERPAYVPLDPPPTLGPDDDEDDEYED